MPATAVTNNPPAQTESKSAKKKRAKAEASTNGDAAGSAPSNPETPATPATEQPATNGVIVSEAENTFLRDLQKSLRNALKKLNATSKVDNIIAENPGKSLDDLVAERKINVDQKAQALRKPALEADVANLERQIAQYKQFSAQWEERLANQKAALEKAHKEELEAEREKIIAETTESNKKNFREQLLVLSKFLRAAAAMRRSGDETSPESRAFEGVLFQVYGGTDEAVDAMLKLINGVDEKIPSVEGDLVEVTYEKVKKASEDYSPEVAWTEEAPATEAAPASDATLANAGSSELQDTTAQTATTNGFATSAPSQPEQVSAPAPQATVGDAANPLAESVATSVNADGWVEVPRNPAETDTGLEGTPAAAAQTSNASTEEAPATTAPAKEEANDGFEQVVHHQRQNSGRGGRGGRGRGRGDGFRGRGRGDFRGRGRGRGDYRGGRGRGGFGGQQGNHGANGTNGSSAPNGTQ